MQPSESTERNADSRMDKNSQDQWQGGQSSLDTGCTKMIIHPRCVTEEDYLGWSIPYNTASARKTHFPAASVIPEIEGKTTTIAVGVSKHITEDMLMGTDIPHFRHYLMKALDVEPGNDKLDTSPNTVTIESGMVVTRAQQLKQGELQERERLQQKQDGSIVSYPVTDGSGVEESEAEMTPPPEDRDGDAESDETVEYLDGVITHTELGHAQKYDSSLN